MKRLRDYSPLALAGAGSTGSEVETVYQHYSEAVTTHLPTGRRFLVEWNASVLYGSIVYRPTRIREMVGNWSQLTTWDYRYWIGSKHNDPDLLLDSAEEVIVEAIREERLSRFAPVALEAV